MGANPARGAYRRLLHFGFRLLYNEMAWSYDSVSWVVSLGEWRAWGRSALRHLNAPPGARVLELAHGTGHMQIALKSAGYIPIGCDLSRAMGRIAARRLRRHGIVPNLVRGYAQQLPFPADSFAAIICTFPTEFIVDPNVIAETYRALQPGGRLVFVPSGSLTGRGVAQSTLEAAYRVTGQRGTWPSAIWERFSAAGYTVTETIEPCSRSVAFVVIAEKS
jgi:ubiquinone/menaquinone biosynthesis C-methylase UbiE